MEWISVKDNLPDVDTCPGKFYESVHVIAYNGEYVLPAIYERTNWPGKKLQYRWKYCWGRTYDGPPITHWMPLPEPPMEDMKKYTMKDFIDGKFAVKVNQKNCKDFLELCAKHRLRWASGEKANEFTIDFDIFEREIVIIHEERPNGMRLAYVVPSFAGDGVPIIDYKDFVDEKAPNCYQILIDYSGTTTTATMTINGREIKTAIARRNPEDKFNWRKDAEVASGRLWGKPRGKTKIRAVKRYANPGEYIKIVDAEGANDENYHDGDILLVTEYYEGERNGWVNAKGASVVIDPHEYVVLEGYRPYESAAKNPQKED